MGEKQRAIENLAPSKTNEFIFGPIFLVYFPFSSQVSAAVDNQRSTIRRYVYMSELGQQRRCKN